MFKRCTQCKKVRLWLTFHKSNTKKNKRRAACKDCANKIARIRRILRKLNPFVVRPLKKAQEVTINPTDHE